MTRPGWIVVLLLLVIAIVWCCFEISALMATTEGMIGFHPAVILAIPVGLFLSLAILACAFRMRSYLAGLASVLPILATFLPFFFGYNLGIAGWSQETRRRSEVNLDAIQRIDFTTAKFAEVPYKSHERMVPIPGFGWNNANEMSAADNGVFFGFTVKDAPHVYICPLKNGARGIAWVTDAKGEVLTENSSVRYEHTGAENWYIWTMSLD